MTLQFQFTVFLTELIAWFSSHPVAVRLAIVIAVLVALALGSYSFIYAEPLGTGGGGCC